MSPLPTLRQLRYLAALEEHRHFGRAADACAVTQSTLSAGIADLEGLLGAALVDRSGRNVAFTPLGLEVVRRAHEVLARATELADVARAGGRPLCGTVRLGAIPTIGPYLLPRALPGLRAAYPDLRLFLREDLTHRLVEDLAAGRIDVALLALPCDCGDAETIELFDDPFLVACPPRHRLASLATVTPDDLAGETLLLLEDGHCLREHALAACGLRPRGAEDFAATSLPTLVQMVAGGLGLTLLPRLAVEGGVLSGTGLVARPVLGEARRIGLGWRRGTRRADEFRLLGERLIAENAALCEQPKPKASA